MKWHPLLDIKPHWKTAVTKTVKLAKKETDQWNRTENAEIDPLAEFI